MKANSTPKTDQPPAVVDTSPNSSAVSGAADCSLDDDQPWECCRNCGYDRDYIEGSEDFCDDCKTPNNMSVGYGSKLRVMFQDAYGYLPLDDDGRYWPAFEENFLSPAEPTLSEPQ